MVNSYCSLTNLSWVRPAISAKGTASTIAAARMRLGRTKGDSVTRRDRGLSGVHSERHIVVSDFLAERLGWGCSCRGWALRAAGHGSWSGRVFASTTAAGRSVSAASTEQDHIFGHHFGEVLLLAVLVIVAARMQTAFHVDL